MNVDNNLVSYFSTLSRPRIAFNILIGFYPYVRGHLAWLVITNSYCMSFEKKCNNHDLFKECNVNFNLRRKKPEIKELI